MRSLINSIIISFLFASISVAAGMLYAKGCPPGERWVPGHKAANGVWIAGHCKPIEENSQCPMGQIWVPGHRGPAGKWIPGHCK